MDLSTTSKQNFEKDELTFVNNRKQKLSMWQQQKILFLRALINIKRDNVNKNLRANNCSN